MTNDTELSPQLVEFMKLSDLLIAWEGQRLIDHVGRHLILLAAAEALDPKWHMPIAALGENDDRHMLHHMLAILREVMAQRGNVALPIHLERIVQDKKT
jgi:hypothetical protein